MKGYCITALVCSVVFVGTIYYKLFGRRADDITDRYISYHVNGNCDTCMGGNTIANIINATGYFCVCDDGMLSNTTYGAGWPTTCRNVPENCSGIPTCFKYCSSHNTNVQQDDEPFKEWIKRHWPWIAGVSGGVAVLVVILCVALVFVLYCLFCGASKGLKFYAKHSDKSEELADEEDDEEEEKEETVDEKEEAEKHLEEKKLDFV